MRHIKLKSELRINSPSQMSSYNDETNRASRYCRPQVITLASKAMANSAAVAFANHQQLNQQTHNQSQQQYQQSLYNNNTSPYQQQQQQQQTRLPITVTAGSINSREGRVIGGLPRALSAPVIQLQPKSCLSRKSCLHHSANSSSSSSSSGDSRNSDAAGVEVDCVNCKCSGQRPQQPSMALHSSLLEALRLTKVLRPRRALHLQHCGVATRWLSATITVIRHRRLGAMAFDNKCIDSVLSSSTPSPASTTTSSSSSSSDQAFINMRCPHDQSKRKTDNRKNGSVRCRKRVIFADDEGQPLTEVRVMSEPSNVPPLWSTKFLEQITQGLVSPHPADQWTVDFKQPASDYLTFRKKIDQDLVSLENVIVKDEESIVVGTVKVKNVSFEKEVIVRVTWDDWKNQQDIFCTFARAYGPATYAHVVFDTFSFKITLPPSSKRLEFCICYRANNQEYWDNNDGKNYTITKRSPFYYNALSPYDKNSSRNAGRGPVMSTLSEALSHATKEHLTQNNWSKESGPYW
ncbi:unnamed protein product [Ceratitis capitata]|uniref:(Mediterranean fruit fly) hypothetical protein n=1 Tax=Ceratitis capitata TaxID=7213 RepID=A0A811V187_CERCA|nr:unnamed protein product [Ceratitis capitata]